MKGFALAAGFGLMNAAIDLLFRHIGGRYSAAEYSALGALAIVSLAAVYWIAMMLTEITASWNGCVRFLTTMVVTIGIPLSMLFTGLWLMRGNSGGTAIAMVLVAAFAALFVIPLLSGWPVAQAQSTHFISPMRILKATKGYRWGLFCASYASTAINKIVPATDTAKDGGQAILLAIGNGAVSSASLVLLASIAATAWKFATRQDPGLARAVATSEG